MSREPAVCDDEGLRTSGVAEADVAAGHDIASGPSACNFQHHPFVHPAQIDINTFLNRAALSVGCSLRSIVKVRRPSLQAPPLPPLPPCLGRIAQVGCRAGTPPTGRGQVRVAGSSPRHNQPPRQLPRQIPAAGLPPHRQAAALPSCQTAFPSPDHAWIHALLLGCSHGGSSSPAPPCAPPPCRRQLPVASCRHPVEREAPHPHACSHTGGARGRLSKVWRMHSAAAARLPGATPPTHLKQAVRTCHSDCQCLLPPKPPELFGARRFLQARLPVCRLASPPHPANTARCRACSAAGCCREAALSRSAARGGPLGRAAGGGGEGGARSKRRRPGRRPLAGSRSDGWPRPAGPGGRLAGHGWPVRKRWRHGRGVGRPGHYPL